MVQGSVLRLSAMGLLAAATVGLWGCNKEPHSAATDVVAESAAKVVEVHGDVRLDGAPLAVGSTVRIDGAIEVGPDGRVVLALDGVGVVRLYPRTRARLVRPERMALKVGRLWAVIDQLVGGRAFEVESPNAVAGVRGTEFVVAVSDDEATTDVLVQAGAVDVAQKAAIDKPVRVQKGKRTQVVANDEPLPAEDAPQVMEAPRWQAMVEQGVGEPGSALPDDDAAADFADAPADESNDLPQDASPADAVRTKGAKPTKRRPAVQPDRDNPALKQLHKEEEATRETLKQDAKKARDTLKEAELQQRRQHERGQEGMEDFMKTRGKSKAPGGTKDMLK